MADQCFWVYILLCSNQTYYTGYTNNLAKRYQSHLSGTGKCKYTRSFKPIAMLQCWEIQGSKALAMQIERQIKTLSRAKKEALIANPHSLLGLVNYTSENTLRLTVCSGDVGS
jgi:putative endonuclease